MQIGVLICEKSAVIRSGLRAVFDSESDIEIVREAVHWRDINSVRCRRRPAVILLGASTGRSFLTALANLRATVDGLGLVAVYNGPATQDLAIHAHLAGASGFIDPESPASDIPDLIRSVAAGGAVIAPITARRLLDLVARLPQHYLGPLPSLNMLSVRELEVLKHLVNGHSNAEIAQRLSIAEATVRSHVSHVMVKLRLRNRVDAVVFAYRYGLGMDHLDRGIDDGCHRSRAELELE